MHIHMPVRSAFVSIHVQHNPEMFIMDVCLHVRWQCSTHVHLFVHIIINCHLHAQWHVTAIKQHKFTDRLER